MRRTLLILIAMFVLALAVAACSSDDDADQSVEGVVTQVTGELGSVESFIVTDANGTSHLFIPAPGLTLHGAPLDHLREHIISGETLVVRYERSDDLQLIAVELDHGS